jgi:hypothetical protein
MYLAEGGSGEFNLADDMVEMPTRTTVEAAQVRFYRNYLDRTSRMLPRSVEIVRGVRAGRRIPDLADGWTEEQLPVVRQCAWIGQNIRFLLLAVTVVPGYPAAFLWLTLVPMSCVLVAILVVHERRAASILQPDAQRLAQAA